jgi:hypothetical protein
MKRAMRVCVALLIIFFTLFLFFLATNSLGCQAVERQYLELKYPGCVVDITETTKLYTRAIVDCEGEEPEVVTIRRK